MEKIESLANSYHRISELKKKLEKELQDARKQILQILDSNQSEKMVVGNYIIIKEVRQMFFVSKEVRETYGVKKDVIYLFIDEKKLNS